MDSPMAQSFLVKKVGEEVIVETKVAKFTWKINSIEYQKNWSRLLTRLVIGISTGNKSALLLMYRNGLIGFIWSDETRICHSAPFHIHTPICGIMVAIRC